MKVLKSGAENNAIPRMEVSCTGIGFKSSNGGKRPCGALLEINPTDVLDGISTDYAGGSDTYYYIMCPNCGCKTEVSYSDMPKEFRRLI